MKVASASVGRSRPVIAQLDDESNLVDVADLKAIAAGDREVFSAFYRRYHARLARFIGRWTRRRDSIDEVINDAMLVIWRRASAFRGEAKVSTWVTGIAYRCLLANDRQAPPREEVNEAASEGAWSIEELDVVGQGDVEHEHMLRDWISKGFSALSFEQRMTLELAYYMGESCEDIALIMDCPVGTVKARMSHARVRLRRVMPNLSGEAPSSVGAPAKGVER